MLLPKISLWKKWREILTGEFLPFVPLALLNAASRHADEFNNNGMYAVSHATKVTHGGMYTRVESLDILVGSALKSDQQHLPTGIHSGRHWLQDMVGFHIRGFSISPLQHPGILSRSTDRNTARDQWSHYIAGFFLFTTNHTNRNCLGSVLWSSPLRPLPWAQSFIPTVYGLVSIPIDNRT